MANPEITQNTISSGGSAKPSSAQNNTAKNVPAKENPDMAAIALEHLNNQTITVRVLI